MSKSVLIFLALASLVLTTVECQAPSTPTAAPPPVPTVTATSTNAVVPTPASTATPIPTDTFVPTPTSTVTPLPTPVPSLSGQVTDAATGQGIAGATVEAWVPGLRTYSTTTASDGSYAMLGLHPGDYIVRVTASGHAREYYDNVNPSSEAKTVHIGALYEAAGIDFKLAKGGAISGHIYESDRVTPIAGAEVFVRPSKYFIDDGFHAATDSEGSYTVENLYLGDFRIYAGADGYTTLKYYGGTYDWNKALNVVVTPPDDTSGIDISLEKAGSISGFVYASDGMTPIPHVSLYAGNKTEEILEGFYTTSRSDGSYVIGGILPGEYTVRTENPPHWYAGEFYDSKYTGWAADRIVVSEGSDTSNINFTLDEGGLVTGRVFDEETGKPVEGINLFACLPNGDCTSPIADSSYDGSYEFVLKPGQYLIGTGRESCCLLGYKYLPEWYDDSYDIDGAIPVDVTLHGITSGIDLRLAKSGSISGYVYNEEGDPIADASVYAFSDVYPGNGANTQSDGSYTIKGLLTGNYLVQATASGYVSEYYGDIAGCCCLN